MLNKTGILLFIFSLALSVLGGDYAMAYSADTSVVIPANYLTFQPPARGGSYTDAVFGTAIKRLTDSMKTLRADTGAPVLGSITPEYSTMSPFNQDNSRLILQHFAYYGLYDGAGNYLKDLPIDVNANAEPRWSRSDPAILYYIRGNQLKQLNVGSNAITVVHTFAEYAAITGGGESDISVDGNHFVLTGDHRQVFVYNIATGTRTNTFDVAGHAFDSLYISPSNLVTITWLSVGPGRYQGIELFDQNMNFVRQLTQSGGHMDIAADTNGDDVLLWTNSNDPTPTACNNGIVKVRLSDAVRTCLVQLDWSLAVHVSAPDNNGWVFVETYSPSDIVPPTGWKAYTDELLQVKLDGTEVRRLAHHRSRPLNGYTYMPKISTSHDGRKVVFGSNFGLQAQVGNPTEYSDVYMIDIGTSASTSPATSTPPPPAPAPAPTPTATAGTLTRVQQDASSVAYAGTWMSNSNGVHNGGSAIQAMDAGSRATFTFNGVSVNWVGYSDEWSGIAAITVDGISKGEFDTYKTPQKAQSTQYSITGLSNGSHTLTIEATGRKRSASGGAWVWIDAFEFAAGETAAPAPTPTPTTSPATAPPPATTPTAPTPETAPAPAASTAIAGGSSVISSGAQTLKVGYAEVVASGTAPADLAIFGYRQNGILVSEAGVPAAGLIQQGRIRAEVAGPINTGFAVANPGDSAATISFYFSDEFGTRSKSGTMNVPAHTQISKFLDEAPFNAARPLNGTFTFSSDVPVSAIALRGYTNERSEFLVTTLPIANLTQPVAATMYFPHLATGGGWVTEFDLVNPSDEMISGTLDFSLSLEIDRQTRNSVPYSIAPRGSARFVTTGGDSAVRSGSARVNPAGGNAAPAGVAIFSFNNKGVRVSEAGVPLQQQGTAFRLYAEASTSIRTGIAVLNSGNTDKQITFELANLDGSSTGLHGAVTIAAGAQRALFLNEIPGFSSLAMPFKGVLRVSTADNANIVVLGLRGRWNERNDFLITTTPPANEADATRGSIVFPHIVDGGGYTTQFIMFSGTAAAPAAGNLQIFSQTGSGFGLTFLD